MNIALNAPLQAPRTVVVREKTLDTRAFAREFVQVVNDRFDGHFEVSAGLGEAQLKKLVGSAFKLAARTSLSAPIGAAGAAVRLLLGAHEGDRVTDGLPSGEPDSWKPGQKRLDRVWSSIGPYLGAAGRAPLLAVDFDTEINTNGESVYVNSESILTAFPRDEELAFAIAHEHGHIGRQDISSSVGTALLARFLDEKELAPSRKAFGHEKEIACDVFAGQTLSQAGMDVAPALENLSSWKAAGDHPDGKARAYAVARAVGREDLAAKYKPNSGWWPL